MLPHIPQYTAGVDWNNLHENLFPGYTAIASIDVAIQGEHMTFLHTYSNAVVHAYHSVSSFHILDFYADII